jgi:hypothetical protein
MKTQNVKRGTILFLIITACAISLFYIDPKSFVVGAQTNKVLDQMISKKELLSNGGFEDWINQSPVSWDPYGQPTLAPETATLINGTYSIKIESWSTIDKGILQRVIVPSDVDGHVLIGNIYIQKMSSREEPSIWLESNSGKSIVFFFTLDGQIWSGNMRARYPL